MMHASVDVLWACVIAETFLTSSSVASVNARGDAHERSVAIVALAGATFAGVQGAGGRTTVIENAVNRILATGNPAYELVAHVCGVDMPELPNRVAGGKRHRCVVAPSAGGLPMRAVADHVRAFERAAGPELVGNAQRVADGKPVNTVA